MSKYGLGSVSYVFLSYLLDREGITQRELCSTLYIDDALASRAMGVLVRKGYVKRLRSKLDARSYELYLTEKGKEVLPELLKMYESWWKQITAGVSQYKMNILCSVLKDISERVIGQELFPEYRSKEKDTVNGNNKSK